MQISDDRFAHQIKEVDEFDSEDSREEMDAGERLKIESTEGPAKLNIRDDRFTVQPEEDAFSDSSEDASR